jgi:hypothetical protein
MSYKKGDVVSVISSAGEFVGKYKDSGASSFVLSDPRMVIQTQEGMGFARGVAVTGVENPTEMSFYTQGIVFVTQTNEEVTKAYHQATSGLIV